MAFGIKPRFGRVTPFVVTRQRECEGAGETLLGFTTYELDDDTNDVTYSTSYIGVAGRSDHVVQAFGGNKHSIDNIVPGDEVFISREGDDWKFNKADQPAEDSTSDADKPAAKVTTRKTSGKAASA